MEIYFMQIGFGKKEVLPIFLTHIFIAPLWENFAQVLHSIFFNQLLKVDAKKL